MRTINECQPQYFTVYSKFNISCAWICNFSSQITTRVEKRPILYAYVCQPHALVSRNYLRSWEGYIKCLRKPQNLIFFAFDCICNQLNHIQRSDVSRNFVSRKFCSFRACLIRDVWGGVIFDYAPNTYADSIIYTQSTRTVGTSYQFLRNQGVSVSVH